MLDSVAQGESPFIFPLVPPCPWCTRIVDTLAPVQAPPLTLTAATWPYLGSTVWGRVFQAPRYLHLVCIGLWALGVTSPWLCNLCALWGGMWPERCQSRALESTVQIVGLLLPRFKVVLCKCRLWGDVEWVSGWSEDTCTPSPRKLDDLFPNVPSHKGGITVTQLSFSHSDASFLYHLCLNCSSPGRLSANRNATHLPVWGPAQGSE